MPLWVAVILSLSLEHIPLWLVAGTSLKDGSNSYNGISSGGENLSIVSILEVSKSLPISKPSIISNLAALSLSHLHTHTHTHTQSSQLVLIKENRVVSWCWRWVRLILLCPSQSPSWALTFQLYTLMIMVKREGWKRRGISFFEPSQALNHALNSPLSVTV